MQGVCGYNIQDNDIMRNSSIQELSVHATFGFFTPYMFLSDQPVWHVAAMVQSPFLLLCSLET